MINNRYIKELKSAAENPIKILAAPIDFDDLNDPKKRINALSLKKKAFIQAKSLISRVLEINPNEQEWSRDKLSTIVDYGMTAADLLFNDINNNSSKEISTIGLDASSISETMNLNDLLVNDAIDLLSSVDEVQRILRQNEVVIKHNDFNGGYAEMYADIFAQKENKSGYRADIDAIAIDPDGSIGEIIELCDIRIALPKPPKRELIQNYNQTMRIDDNFPYQIFRREPIPKSLTIANAKTHEDFINKQYEYKRKGFWFFNNGKKEYITGAHWMLLNHYRTGADGGFYYFTKAQQKLFWMIAATDCDERCYGLILEKIRRFGATDCASCASLSAGLNVRDKIIGMTSKTNEDARKNFIRITSAFSKLPFYFKPLCRDPKSKSVLEFSTPGDKLSKTKKEEEKVDDSLNTYFDYESTSADSYDGVALYRYIVDEFSKWKKQNGNTITHWEMVRKSLTKGKRITGKAFILSTVENVTGLDAFDDDAEAGDRYKWLYYNSDPNKRDENGRTKTGLYKMFLSCYEHYEGLIDIFGYPIVEDPLKPIKTIDGGFTNIGIKTFIRNESEPFRDNPKSLYDYFRKNPIEEEDGFRIGKDACMFNQINILNHKNHNDEVENSGHPQYRRGNFEWKNNVKDCNEVVWVDSPTGRFLVSWLPSEEYRNNITSRNGLRFPGNNAWGGFGIDPYKVNKTVDGRGSKGSIHGYSITNPIGAPNNNFFLEYINRPETRDVFHEDAIKALIFYGMSALIENNVNNLLEDMQKRGYRNYSKNRPDKPKSKLSYDEVMYGGMPSNGENVLQMQASALEYHIETNIGEKTTEDGDKYFPLMPFQKTLLDWLVFDIKDRTKRDASISSSLAILGCPMQAKKQIDVNENKQILKKLFPVFNNKGVRGIVEQ